MKLIIKLTSGITFSTDFMGQNVQECKQHLSNAHSCPPPAVQRLIYKGRILDDGQKLQEDYGIVEGSTLFLVAMKEPPAVAVANGTTAAVAAVVAGTASPATATATNNTPTIPGTSASGTPTDISRLIQHMTQMQTQGSSAQGAGQGRVPPTTSSTAATTTTADPLQSLMNDNPDFLANMMQSQMENNPSMRQLMEQNPMVREALSDPAALRQMMQTMSNPELRAQQQRHHDLALANIENMPGGFNMLRNLYENVQVPLDEAATAGGTGSAPPSGGRMVNNTNNNNSANPTSDTTAGATNQAMPNPWGSSRPSRTTNTTGSGSSANRNATMTNPFAAMGGGMMGGGMMGGGAGGQQQQPSREQQEAAITMLESNPMLQQMLSESIRQNPAMLRQMMQSANPAAAAMMNNMSDEQLAGMMDIVTNPTAMRGMMRIQDNVHPNGGLPDPMEMMALMGMGGGGGNVGANNNSPFSGANPFLAGNPFLGGAPPAAFAPNPWAASSTSSYSSPSGVPSSSATPPQQPPAVRYARQLEQMRSMGFDDEAAALTALERANGNLNRAVDLLLDSSSATGGGGDNTTTDT
jgi:ubiquilin